jgi:hypothetical protein
MLPLQRRPSGRHIRISKLYSPTTMSVIFDSALFFASLL